MIFLKTHFYTCDAIVLFAVGLLNNWEVVYSSTCLNQMQKLLYQNFHSDK